MEPICLATNLLTLADVAVNVSQVVKKLQDQICVLERILESLDVSKKIDFFRYYLSAGWEFDEVSAFLESTVQMRTAVQGLLAYFQRRLEILSFWALFFFFFSEFPDGIRHICTAMPWTIWPSLVVLWGVCWMFYPSPPPLNAFTVPENIQGLSSFLSS